MLFTSPIFLFGFLPLFLMAYYLPFQSSHYRNLVALAGSIFFFAWGEPIFVFILILFTLIDYKVSIWVTPNSCLLPGRKKALLAAAICFDVIILMVSKYLDFIIVEILPFIEPIVHLKLKPIHLPLLLGISFITFHRISYLVDSYKGRATPPRNFFDCALYIFLFPQLIAGPIIRYHDIGSQIHYRKHTAEGFLTGFFRFSIGLAKKLIFADPLGLATDRIFGFQSESISLIFAWGGILAYTLQIYFDFSAYSDMAIGLGKMIGFRFPENFNRPYTSRSITEFWRRWHISLSKWMLLYLYIPMGGNRVSALRNYINLWIVFLISGLWHGASWNFIIWGAYYGFFLSAERAFSSRPFFKFLFPGVLRQILTLLIVIVGWVLFRSPSLGYAINYIGVMFGFITPTTLSLPPWGLIFENRVLSTMMAGALLACVKLPTQWTMMLPLSLRSPWSEAMTVHGTQTMAVQFMATLFLIALSSSAIVSSDYVPFLYFRF